MKIIEKRIVVRVILKYLREPHANKDIEKKFMQ